MTVGMRTVMRLKRQKIKDDKDADVVEAIYWSTLCEDRK